uniref:Uncharacterized protein n=1 Tax=Glossina morsitans morsitans TaxID=37546 RepID=A0A1B0FJW6_GLOMM
MLTVTISWLILLSFVQVQPKQREGVKTPDLWRGLWFPYPPEYEYKTNIVKKANSTACDNGKDNIGIDYDPKDKRDSYHYLCLSNNRTKYQPNINTTALLNEYFIPPAYQPSVKCLDEIIYYREPLPTYGSYRPLAPKYGVYNYLPPQRWLHSLANGAIVLLYHPCAFPGQVNLLKNILQSCLYRRIVTPSQLPSTERPIVLLSWGKSLQMSVVDERIALNFIKENAKHGLKQKQKMTSDRYYDIDLLSQAHLLTNEEDGIICGYNDVV